MTLTFTITTLAIKFEKLGWSIHRVARTNKTTDKIFILSYENEWNGNGIQEIKILEHEKINHEIEMDELLNVTEMFYAEYGCTEIVEY